METTLKTEKVGIKEVALCKNYMAYLIANTISRFGDSLDSIAYGWMVYNLTGSIALMSTLYIINALPNIIIAPVAGTFADRHYKKRIIIVSHTVRGVVVACTALLLLLGILKPWYLFIFTFINSTMETFCMSASSALMPVMLEEKYYLPAQGFSTSLSRFAELLGTAAAGIIVGLLGISGAIFIDSATFIIAAVIIIFITINGDTMKNEPGNLKVYTTDFIEGIKYMSGKKVIFICMLLFALMNFCLGPMNILMTAYIKDILKSGPEAMSIIGTTFSIGAIAGGLFISQFGSKFKIASTMIFGFAMFGAAYSMLYIPGNINLGSVSPIIFTAVMYFIMSFVIPVITSPISALIMKSTPKDMMGRVSSVLNITCTCTVPLGGAFTGIVCSYTSVSNLFLYMGIIIMIAAAAIVFVKDLRKI